MRFTRFAAPLFAVSLLAGSAHADEPSSKPKAEDMRLRGRLDGYDPRVPPPVGYEVVTKRSDKLLASGIVAASVTYATTAAIATHVTFVADGGKHARDAWPMFVPLLGPFVTMSNVDPKAPSADLAYFGLAMTGAAQVVGFTMLAAGLAFERPELVRVSRSARVEVRAAPLLGKEVQGLGLAGSF